MIVFILQIFDTRTTVVFCDVGQGDGVYMRIQNKIDVIIDAGPDRSILSCLGKYMPFWDRKIELAFLSHPNNDHYNGYFFITDRYKIDKFITVESSIVSKTYKTLLNKISTKNIPLLYKVVGDRIKVEDGQFTIYWPPMNFISPHDNDFSSVILFNRGGSRPALTFQVLFTGDASPFVLSKLLHQSFGTINILKVPHHGSKNGLTKGFLELVNPRVAVISVGKNNSYGHPTKKVLDLLKAQKINIKRTDIEGDILFNF